MAESLKNGVIIVASVLLGIVLGHLISYTLNEFGITNQPVSSNWNAILSLIMSVIAFFSIQNYRNLKYVRGKIDKNEEADSARDKILSGHDERIKQNEDRGKRNREEIERLERRLEREINDTRLYMDKKFEDFKDWMQRLMKK